MLMKLTPIVNFINILRAVFELIFFHQKKSKPNCDERKAAQSTFVQKRLWENVDESDTWCQFHQR